MGTDYPLEGSGAPPDPQQYVPARRRPTRDDLAAALDTMTQQLAAANERVAALEAELFAARDALFTEARRAGDVGEDLRTSQDAFRRLQEATNCACHKDEEYVPGSVCQDCFGEVVQARDEAQSEAIKERSTLYAALEDAQTQRVRESQANTDLARANRGLVALLAHVTGNAPRSKPHYWPTKCYQCDEVLLVLAKLGD